MLEDIGKRPILKRWILSIDIGYRNFAYCIMDSSNRSIVEWRNIELFDQGYPEAYNVSIYCQAVIRICNQRFSNLDKSSLTVLVEEQQQYRKGYYKSDSVNSMIPTIFRINIIEAMVHTWFQSALNIPVISISPSKMGRYQQSYLASLGILDSQLTNKKKLTAEFLSYVVQKGEVTVLSHLWEMYESVQKKDDLLILFVIYWFTAVN